MAQTAFSIRMDDGLKREFSSFCENIGMNMSTAFVIFAKTAVRERRFPFEIAEQPTYRYYEDAPSISNRARSAFEHMRRQVESSDVAEPTMDDINAFIANTRAQRRSRSSTGVRT